MRSTTSPRLATDVIRAKQVLHGLPSLGVHDRLVRPVHDLVASTNLPAVDRVRQQAMQRPLRERSSAHDDTARVRPRLRHSAAITQLIDDSEQRVELQVHRENRTHLLSFNDVDDGFFSITSYPESVARSPRTASAVASILSRVRSGSSGAQFSETHQNVGVRRPINLRINCCVTRTMPRRAARTIPSGARSRRGCD